jgi:hypothetical protein
MNRHAKNFLCLYLFIVIIFVPLNLSAQTIVISSPTAAPKLRWNARLYPKNDDFVEVILDTRNFPPNSCLNQISVLVVLLNEKGEAQSKQFEFDKSQVLGGGVFVNWFAQRSPSTRNAKGKKYSVFVF